MHTREVPAVLTLDGALPSSHHSLEEDIALVYVSCCTVAVTEISNSLLSVPYCEQKLRDSLEKTKKPGQRPDKRVSTLRT